MYVKGILKDLQKKHTEIEIASFDIAKNLNRWKELNVKVFPALKINDEIKAWYFPEKNEIEEFVTRKLLEKKN